MTINNTTLSNEIDVIANGRASSNAFVDQFAARDPTPQDVNYPIQKKWLNTTTNRYWELKNFVAANGITTANWVKIGSGIFTTETLTGNTGGPVSPDINNNINVLGDGTFITVVGTPLNNTLTIEPAGGLTTLYTEDTGTATPSSGNLNVFGGTGVNTVGSGNTITINAIGVAFNYTNVTHAMSPYTVLTSDHYISVDCSGGVVTLDFPNSPTFKQVWIVKDRTGNASANHITLTTPGGTVTIDGSTSYVITSNYGAVNILANATPTYEVY